MKIVNIMGGLGNQMFEYAFALSLQDRFPDEEVLIDTSHYGHIFSNAIRGLTCIMVLKYTRYSQMQS